MGTNSENVRANEASNDKAAIREKPKEKPIGKAQIKELKKLFDYYSATRNIVRAHTALKTLPISEHHTLDKGPYFRALLERNEKELIEEVLNEGTPNDIKLLQQQFDKMSQDAKLTKIVNETPIILKSTRKYRPPQANNVKPNNYFSNMKKKFKAMLSRSASIQPDNSSILSSKEDLSKLQAEKPQIHEKGTGSPSGKSELDSFSETETNSSSSSDNNSSRLSR